MKIVFVGGHFSPLLAVISSLNKDDYVAVLGRKFALEGEKTLSFEYLVCQEKGIPFFEIPAGRLQRKFTRFTITSILRSPKGFISAKNILKKERPDVVVSFGGYLSVPVAIAASSLNIPVIIHEQTQKAGLANKLIGRFFAKKICVTFESSRKYFPQNKVVVTGNPLREEIVNIGRPLFNLSKDEKLLYITGGSTGSHFINTLIFENLEILLKRFTVLHQTGDSSIFKDFDKATEKRSLLPQELQEKYIVKKFIKPFEIGWVLQNTQCVVSRAGINTVLELMALSIPALLIPLPHGQAGEQLENAKLFESKGFGKYLLQDDASGNKFIDTLQEVSEKKRIKSGKDFKKPAEAIIDIIRQYEASPTEKE